MKHISTDNSHHFGKARRLKEWPPTATAELEIDNEHSRNERAPRFGSEQTEHANERYTVPTLWHKNDEKKKNGKSHISTIKSAKKAKMFDDAA